MPAKRRKKNAKFGLVGKIGAEWRGEGRNICQTLEIKCGRGLAPDGDESVKRVFTDIPPSGASPLPQGLRRVLDQTKIEVPVISAGFSSPNSFSMVGATSASTPPSRTFRSRLPT